MASIVERSDSVVQLREVAWDVYVALRASPENRNVRMTYDRGTLEIMSPSKLHERIAELLARMVQTWTEQRGIPVQSCGSVTFQRPDLARGLEPDKCFYIAHESIVREREELDLAVDPPPDLVIEVDVTSLSRDRLPLYAAIHVSEVWLWRKERLQVLQLDDPGRYQERPASAALPGFPLTEAQRLLTERTRRDETSIIREFRAMIGS